MGHYTWFVMSYVKFWVGVTGPHMTHLSVLNMFQRRSHLAIFMMYEEFGNSVIGRRIWPSAHRVHLLDGSLGVSEKRIPRGNRGVYITPSEHPRMVHFEAGKLLVTFGVALSQNVYLWGRRGAREMITLGSPNHTVKQSHVCTVIHVCIIVYVGVVVYVCLVVYWY